MPRLRSDYPPHIKPGFWHKRALNMEKTRFLQFLEVARPTKTVFTYHFWGGVASGFGLVIGATLVASLVLALLGVLGDVLPGEPGRLLLGLNHLVQERLGWR